MCRLFSSQTLRSKLFIIFIIVSLENIVVSAELAIDMVNPLTEFDGRLNTGSPIVLRCPIPNAVWILPYQVNLDFVGVRQYPDSSHLVLKRKDIIIIWGTYSCCPVEVAPPYYRRHHIHSRDLFTCLNGCCPSFRKQCAIDNAETRCRQLRLFIPPNEGMSGLVMLKAVHLKGLPFFIPCFTLKDNVEVKLHNDHTPIKSNFIPGYGYCAKNVTIIDFMLRCFYTDKGVVQKFSPKVFLSNLNFASRPGQSLKENPRIEVQTTNGTKRVFRRTPAVVNLVKDSNVTFRCSVPRRPACLSWENITCTNCDNHRRLDYTFNPKKSERLTCVAYSQSDWKPYRIGVHLNVSSRPFLNVMLDHDVIPIIQHITEPVISVNVSMSPQTSVLTLVAINPATSTRIRGRCHDWNTMCTISLQRPYIKARYQLIFEVPELKPTLKVVRWVTLISQYNRRPNITGLPRIGLVGKLYKAQCQQDANPKGSIEWLEVDSNGKISNRAIDSSAIDSSGDLVLNNTADRRSCVACRVNSSVGSNVSKSWCMIRSDVEVNGYDSRLIIESKDPIYYLQTVAVTKQVQEMWFVLGAMLSVRCVSYRRPDEPRERLLMVRNNQTISFDDLTSSWSNYSFQVRLNLSLSNVSVNNTWFFCNAPKNWTTSPHVILRLRRRQPPVIGYLQPRRRVLDSRELHQECVASGIPKPVVYWRYKDANVSVPGRGRSQLVLTDVTRANSGIYTCVAHGAKEVAETAVQIDVNPTVFESKELIIVMSVVFVIFVICFLFIGYLFIKNRRLRVKLFDRYSLFLRTGDGENNYATQFDLSQWQLSAQDLRLTREKLGQGEFGRVLKGLLRKAGNDVIPVAVKQLLSNNLIMGVGRPTDEDSVSRRKFMEEIQIMSQVGQHENVLQMLGVVIDESTLQISLVCEYCENGNLVNYLQSHQTTFSMRPFSPGAEDCLTFEDLLCLSGDIARGMAHIHSVGILHRDLAARNVLIGANKKGKISDFGLSRNRGDYSGLEYARRNTNEKLPWKWLALESLREGKFSAKSDVWSYGITLWEVFSLGNKPYPEQYYTNYFICNLNSGYRLSRPPFASDSVFEVMKSCWLTEPELRPNFSQITTTFQSLVERWRAEGERGRTLNEKQSLMNGNGPEKPKVHVQYVNVVGVPPNQHPAECEIKLMEAYVPMSEGSAYTTYSTVF